MPEHSTLQSDTSGGRARSMWSACEWLGGVESTDAAGEWQRERAELKKRIKELEQHATAVHALLPKMSTELTKAEKKAEEAAKAAKASPHWHRLEPMPNMALLGPPEAVLEAELDREAYRICSVFQNSLHSVPVPDRLGLKAQLVDSMRACELDCRQALAHYPPLPPPPRWVSFTTAEEPEPKKEVTHLDMDVSPAISSYKRAVEQAQQEEDHVMQMREPPNHLERPARPTRANSPSPDKRVPRLLSRRSKSPPSGSSASPSRRPASPSPLLSEIEHSTRDEDSGSRSGDAPQSLLGLGRRLREQVRGLEQKSAQNAWARNDRSKERSTHPTEKRSTHIEEMSSSTHQPDKGQSEGRKGQNAAINDLKEQLRRLESQEDASPTKPANRTATGNIGLREQQEQIARLKQQSPISRRANSGEHDGGGLEHDGIKEPRQSNTWGYAGMSDRERELEATVAKLKAKLYTDNGM